MANDADLARLKQGVVTWNTWYNRNEAKGIKPDLRGAVLTGMDLRGIILANTDLRQANLSYSSLHQAILVGADLRGADLTLAAFVNANLHQADLRQARLTGAAFMGADLATSDLQGVTLDGDFSRADFACADLRGATFLPHIQLTGARLANANLQKATLSGVDFSGVDLRDADLSWADLRAAKLNAAVLTRTNFTGANLQNSSLVGAYLVWTNLESADITGCNVFGSAAWGVRRNDKTRQKQLIVTPPDVATITVDDLEVAQVIYLLLNNEKIRSVIDTITSKVVLILGRFTPERKVVLEAIQNELRKRDYVPVLFDFEKPASKDLTGTISTLANLARFIIADLTDPSSVPHELATLVPGTVVPVQAIILEGQREYAMFPDLMRRHHWVLDPHQYKSKEKLIAQLSERVIAPAEAKANELARK
jgi:uncharacterized protein YjbI with pentapeptide repeats